LLLIVENVEKTVNNSSELLDGCGKSISDPTDQIKRKKADIFSLILMFG